MEYSQKWLDDDQNHLLVTIQGDITYGNFWELQKEFNAMKSAPPQNISIDLKDVSHIDSSGLGLLITCGEILGDSQRLTLKNPSKMNQKLFEVCNFYKMMKIEQA